MQETHSKFAAYADRSKLPLSLTVADLAAAQRSTERIVLGHQCWHVADRVFEVECAAILQAKLPIVRGTRLAEIQLKPAKAEIRCTPLTELVSSSDERAAELENLRFVQRFLVERAAGD